MAKNKLIYAIAGFLLLAMFLLAFFTLKDDTFTFDEVAHIGAGYSYLTMHDYRLNPEHPPLIKDLAALPLLFIDLYSKAPKFLIGNPVWENASPAIWWHQFNFGFQFLYHFGNNPDQILFWSRLPMIFVMLLLGFFIFFWSRKLWGNKAALLALFLYCFSPTFLAHGRLITTDVGAALGATLAAYFWLNFLKNPSKKNIIFAGLFFGVAMLIKFSLILLLPFLAIITLVYAWLNTSEKKLKNISKYLLLSILAGLIGLVFVIWPVYQFHVFNYPVDRQIRDTRDLLATTNVKALTGINVWLEENPVTRPLGQYFLGLLTATNRTATGNTTYFKGDISADSWRSYFPFVYFAKNPLPFHILTLIGLLYALWCIKRPWWKNAFQRKLEWIKNHFVEFSMLCWLGIYWLTSIISNLNIGVRHLMPVFPFTIMLVSALISGWLKEPRLKLKLALIAFLLIWQAVSVISIYPHFLAYFNELIGGPSQGYRYVVDSNLDWGQDLKRLKSWMDENKIDKIYLDYFGGGEASYYLKERSIAWWAERNKEELPAGSYLAISANQLQGNRAEPTKGYKPPENSCIPKCYNWLNDYEPIEVIGYSIFIYKIE